jgi:hypothetical protein
MLKLTFCLRRKPEMTREEFQFYWFNNHAPMVKKYAEATGTRQYVQMHTRDNELTATIRRGKRGKTGELPEGYDGVAQIYWDSVDDFRIAAQRPDNLDAAKILLEDERKFIDLANSPLWFGEEKVGVGDPDPKWRRDFAKDEKGALPLVKLTYPLHRKAGMTREDFQSYWLHKHMPLIQKHGKGAPMVRYVQLHTDESTEYTAPLRRSRAGKGNVPPPIYDGIAELWWRDIDAAHDAIKNPDTLEASRLHEAEFIDHASSPLFYGEERFIFG